MPTYEYVCDACGYEFEKFQSITASAIRKCPECGKMKVRRLIGSGSGIIFRGSGFYQTDYRSSGYSKDAGADKKKKESASKSSDSGTSASASTKSDGGSSKSSSSSDKAAG